MKQLILIPVIIFISNLSLLSQDNGSLLDALGSTDETIYIDNTFKSPRVINSHSVEMLGKGVLDFRILHRLAPLRTVCTKCSALTMLPCV